MQACGDDYAASETRQRAENQRFCLVFQLKTMHVFPMSGNDFLVRTSLQESPTADTLTTGQVVPPANAASPKHLLNSIENTLTRDFSTVLEIVIVLIWKISSDMQLQ